MKDTKSLLLLILSLLLIVVSLALLWTWGYNYGREKYKPPIVNHDTFSAGFLSEDSLNELYNQAVSNLNNLDSALTKADSLKLDITGKLNEFYKLRDEIAAMQGKSDVNSEKNISELESKLNDLSSQNKEIIKENQRLTALLNELTKNNKVRNVVNVPVTPQKTENQTVKSKIEVGKNSKTVVVTTKTENKKAVKVDDSNKVAANPTKTVVAAPKPDKKKVVKVADSNIVAVIPTKPAVVTTKTSTKVKITTPQATEENSNIASKSNKPNQKPNSSKSKDNVSSSATFFSVTDMNITGLAEDDNKFIETNNADQTIKINGSFVLKNVHSDLKKGDIHIVISKPDGKLLQSSTWDAGTFETSNGRRIYSTKVKYDCDIGESKKINFSISADQYPKGNYSFDVYQNGYIIGKGAKVLQ
jgi:hypothetical protein